MLSRLRTFPLCAIVLMIGLLTPLTIHAGENMENSDVTSQVDVRSFVIGESSEAGSFIYIVDRTTGMCFASLRIARAMGSGLGLTQIECKRLTRIPTIGQYIKTGRVK